MRAIRQAVAYLPRCASRGGYLPDLPGAGDGRFSRKQDAAAIERDGGVGGSVKCRRDPLPAGSRDQDDGRALRKTVQPAQLRRRIVLRRGRDQKRRNGGLARIRGQGKSGNRRGGNRPTGPQRKF